MSWDGLCSAMGWLVEVLRLNKWRASLGASTGLADPMGALGTSPPHPPPSIVRSTLPHHFFFLRRPGHVPSPWARPITLGMPHSTTPLRHPRHSDALGTSLATNCILTRVSRSSCVTYCTRTRLSCTRTRRIHSSRAIEHTADFPNTPPTHTHKARAMYTWLTRPIQQTEHMHTAHAPVLRIARVLTAHVPIDCSIFLYTHTPFGVRACLCACMCACVFESVCALACVCAIGSCYSFTLAHPLSLSLCLSVCTCMCM